MHWSEAYLGLPFAAHGRDRSGVDCWGLVTLCFRDVLGIDLPSYCERYASLAERAEIAAALREGKANGHWQRSARPLEWDVALFARAWGLDHVGIVVAPGLFLHASEDAGEVRIDRYGAPQWASRLEGTYRYIP